MLDICFFSNLTRNGEDKREGAINIAISTKCEIRCIICAFMEIGLVSGTKRHQLTGRVLLQLLSLAGVLLCAQNCFCLFFFCC